MPRKSKDEQIQYLKKQIEFCNENLERLSKRNEELENAEENTFLHSPTYIQMQEEIKLRTNLLKMNEWHLANVNGKFHKSNEEFKQIYEDNKKLIEHETDTEYFIGITKNWVEAWEYQKLISETSELKGRLEEREIAVLDREKEIERLQKEIAELKKSQKLISEAEINHNVRNAGRKKKSESAKHKEDIRVLRELIESHKTMDEIMEIMNISRTTYFRYKKEL